MTEQILGYVHIVKENPVENNEDGILGIESDQIYGLYVII